MAAPLETLAALRAVVQTKIAEATGELEVLTARRDRVAAHPDPFVPGWVIWPSKVKPPPPGYKDTPASRRRGYERETVLGIVTQAVEKRIAYVEKLEDELIAYNAAIACLDNRPTAD